MTPPVSRKLAERLIDYEASAGKNSGLTAPAAFRVFEKLRAPLSALTGVAGFRSLLSCALRLARTEAPSLRPMQVAEDASLQGLGALDPQEGQNDSQTTDGGAVLIAHLLGLLITFIGEGVTLRLVQDVWPEVALDHRVSGKERKA